MNAMNVITLFGTALIVSIGAAAVTSSTGSHDICHGLQCPNFTVINKTEAWELRHYGPTKWVATNTTAMFRDDVNSQLFWLLFQYIDHANAAHAKIEMTSPVVTKVTHGQGPNCESQIAMHFMLPFAYWDKPIAPTNPAVYIQELPAMDVYVRSFGGFAKEQDYVDNIAELAGDLSGPNFHVESSYFFTAGYDGPYTFVNRHNEVWIQRA